MDVGDMVVINVLLAKIILITPIKMENSLPSGFMMRQLIAPYPDIMSQDVSNDAVAKKGTINFICFHTV